MLSQARTFPSALRGWDWKNKGNLLLSKQIWSLAGEKGIEFAGENENATGEGQQQMHQLFPASCTGRRHTPALGDQLHLYRQAVVQWLPWDSDSQGYLHRQ